MPTPTPMPTPLFTAEEIDAARTLSVQVHPDEETAARLGGRAKSEAWFILGVEPGAKLYLGLAPGTSRDDLERALSGGEVADLLSAIEPSPGDLVPVPPGTVHAGWTRRPPSHAINSWPNLRSRMPSRAMAGCLAANPSTCRSATGVSIPSRKSGEDR